MWNYSKYDKAKCRESGCNAGKILGSGFSVAPYSSKYGSKLPVWLAQMHSILQSKETHEEN